VLWFGDVECEVLRSGSQAQRYIADGYNVVVDLDLEKFFERVNHDGLMARVAGRVSDKPVLKLIRAFLNAGVMRGFAAAGPRLSQCRERASWPPSLDPRHGT
jgi:hypothetical protein